MENKPTSPPIHQANKRTFICLLYSMFYTQWELYKENEEYILHKYLQGPITETVIVDIYRRKNKVTGLVEYNRVIKYR